MGPPAVAKKKHPAAASPDDPGKTSICRLCFGDVKFNPATETCDRFGIHPATLPPHLSPLKR